MTKPTPTHILLPAVLLMLAAPLAASAQTSPSLSGLYACEGLSNQDAQLSCFLAETAKLRAVDGPGASPAAPTTAALSASDPIETQSLAAQRESLAAEKARLADERDRIAAEKTRMAEAKKKASAMGDARETRILDIASATKFGPNRYIRFTLENGEVWQQTETAYVRLGKSDAPDTLRLKPAAMGYRGQVNEKGRVFRLKRLK